MMRNIKYPRIIRLISDLRGKQITNIKSKKGFTLIELLIVIALLGALAVGLLAAVDPFEQLKKGTDTSRRNTVVEFYNAAIRYYAVNSEFPWSTAPNGIPMNSMSAEIGKLETAGELKSGFSSLAGGTAALMKMYVTSVTTAGSETVAVCYQPESKSFKLDKNDQFDIYGTVTNGCLSQTSGTNPACYWCIK